jgi:hypothetical protein
MFRPVELADITGFCRRSRPPCTRSAASRRTWSPWVAWSASSATCPGDSILFYRAFRTATAASYRSTSRHPKWPWCSQPSFRWSTPISLPTRGDRRSTLAALGRGARNRYHRRRSEPPISFGSRSLARSRGHRNRGARHRRPTARSQSLARSRGHRNYREGAHGRFIRTAVASSPIKRHGRIRE